MADLVPPGIKAVLSSAAWDDYDVPGSPYFVLVDGAEGRVVGAGSALRWGAVAEPAPAGPGRRRLGRHLRIATAGLGRTLGSQPGAAGRRGRCGPRASVPVIRALYGGQSDSNGSKRRPTHDCGCWPSGPWRLWPPEPGRHGRLEASRCSPASARSVSGPEAIDGR